MTKHLYIHSPQVVAFGTINASFNNLYPVAELPIVSFSDMENVKRGMTVIFGSAAGLDDLGRQRIRQDHFPEDDILMVGYSSQGIHDGEIDVTGGDHFTVLDDRRIWPVHQRFVKQEVEPFVTVLKDWDRDFLALGMSQQNFPKANAGPARGGTIDSITGFLTCDFDASESYALFGSVGIASFLWDFKDGVVTTGGEDQETATVDFPAGFRYISLTITDNNGKSHRMEVPVIARDPANDICVPVWQISLMHNEEGQTATIKIYSDLPRSTYPDGAVVMYFDDDRDNHYTDFYGWIYTDPLSLQFVQTGALRDTTLDALDVAGMLNKIPSQVLSMQNVNELHAIPITEDAAIGAMILIVAPLEVELHIGDTLDVNGLGTNIITLTTNGALGTTAIGVEPLSAAVTAGDYGEYETFPQKWGEAYHPHILLLLDYIGRWHSTAWELADFLKPPLDAGWTRNFYVREVGASTVFRQLSEVAHSICIDHYVGCNVKGQLVLRYDSNLHGTINRVATVQGNLNGHIGSVRVTHKRSPALQWIRGGAILEALAPTATFIDVEYFVRPSATALIGATSVSVYALSTDIPNGTVLNLVGLEGQLIPRITLTADANENDTSLTVVALDEQVEIYDEYQYTIQESGPDVLPKAFAVAPGLTPGWGTESMTINNKLAQNGAELAAVIGRLWAKLNSEWGDIDIDLIDEDLELLDPTEWTWVTADAINNIFVPQRNLPLFQDGDRFMVKEVRKSYSYDKSGIVGSISIRVEKETFGSIAVQVEDTEI